MPHVAPTRTDPVAANGSELIGGPLGRWSAPGTPAKALQAVLVVGAATFAAGVLRTIPCVRYSWAEPGRYEWMCYSDIPALFVARGLSDGSLPYLPNDGQPLEYPVLTGLFAWFGGLFVPSADSHQYYWVTAILLFACFLAALAATAMYARHRVWDGLLLAFAPSVLLVSLINWDLLAVALTALGMLAWSRSRPVLAGALLGLAVAAKFYPLLIFGPLALLCWRRRRMREFAAAAAAACVAWLVVNLPFLIAAPDGWSHFFTLSSQRGQDLGSIWMAFSLLGWQVAPNALNLVASLALAWLCLVIAALALRAPRPPRIAQLAFLVVAAFLVTNKVYSPQYALWLLPLAVLARPRWRDLLIWQGCEALYFAAVWWYLIAQLPDYRGLPNSAYALAIFVHIAGTCYLAAVVIRDILRPEHDPVRVDPPHLEVQARYDDPGGGVLDEAPDRYSKPRT